MRRLLPPCLLLALLTACQAGGKAPVSPARPTATPAAKASTAAPAAPRELQRPPGNPTVLAGTVQLDAGYMASVNAGHRLAQAFAVADAQLLSNNGANIISDNGGGIISNNGGGVVSNNGAGLTSKVKWGLLADAVPALGQQLPIAGMALAVVGLGDRQALPVGVDAAGKPAYVVYTDAAGHYKLYLGAEQTRNVEVVALVPNATDARLAYGLVVDPKLADEQAFNEESALASDYLRNTIYEMFATTFNSDGSSADASVSFERIPEPLRPLAIATIASFVENAEERKKLSAGRFRRALRRVADALVARVDLANVQNFPFVDGENRPILQPGPAIPALEAQLKEIDDRAAALMAANPAYFEGKPYVLEANFHRASLGLPPVAIKRPSDLGRFTSDEYEGSSAPGRLNSSWAVLVDVGLTVDKDTVLRRTYQSIFIGVLQQIMGNQALHDELKQVENGIFADELDPTKLPEPELPTPAKPPFEIPAEPAATVGTLVGTANAGATDGLAASATVDHVSGLAVLGGKLYFTQGDKLRVVDLAATGQPVSTVAGTSFNGIQGLVADPAAAVPTLYVGDYGLHKLFKVELPAGQPARTTFLAGSGAAVVQDGTGAAASFNALTGLALDGHGGLVVTDNVAERIRRVDLATGAVTTVLGELHGYSPGGFNGPLSAPWGVLVAPSGDLFTVENIGSRLFSQGKDGIPRLVAGMSGDHNAVDGFYLGAGFRNPTGLAFDADGSILVGDTGGERVRRVRLRDGGGVVTTVAGSGKEDEPGFADGPGTTARFAGPGALAVGPDGTIYVAEAMGTRIRTIRR